MSNNITKRLTNLGMMSAVALILAVFVHIPLVPSVAFLAYEPKMSSSPLPDLSMDRCLAF